MEEILPPSGGSSPRTSPAGRPPAARPADELLADPDLDDEDDDVLELTEIVGEPSRAAAGDPAARRQAGRPAPRPHRPPPRPSRRPPP